MMTVTTTRFRTSVAASALAGCALQLASIAAQADSAKLPGNAKPPSVVALEDRDVPRQVVPYRDLNLSSPEGMRSLEARITRAVDGVCADAWYQGASRIQAQRDCKDAALADAMAQVRALAVAEELTARAQHGCRDAALANDAVAQAQVATVHGDDAAR